VEDRSPYNVSRKHCSVGIVDDQLEVIDHGSTLGTRVNGCRIGTAAGQMQAPLRMGDNEIVLGSSDRGHRFRITVSRKAD
jgi:pSer/pThr/pTyr-binding forkhead associated (FHA) protein